MKKILQVITNYRSYDQIRIIQPFAEIREKLKEENITINFIPLDKLNVEIARQFDVCVFHGCLSFAAYSILPHIKFSIWCDDLMWDLPPSNPAAPKPKEIEGLYWCFSNAQSIVVTTEYLKSRIFHPHKTFVAPNLLDINRGLWRQDAQDILYSFGNSHTGDLELLNNLKTDRQVYFFGDTLPSKFCNYYRNPKGIIELYPNAENIHWIPLQTDYERYQIWLNNIEAGIGLCPLEDNDFNKAKSVLKIGEYLKKGMVSVVSNIGPYQGVPDECVVKVLESDWSAAVEYGFTNRTNILDACYAWWQENYSYRKNYTRWLDVYRNL